MAVESDVWNSGHRVCDDEVGCRLLSALPLALCQIPPGTMYSDPILALKALELLESGLLPLFSASA